MGEYLVVTYQGQTSPWRRQETKLLPGPLVVQDGEKEEDY